MVEGYLDCIALHQAGFANVVAVLGTAFTPEQARELRKVASSAILCFDADPAGIEAALKSIDVLAAGGYDELSRILAGLEAPTFS